MSEPMPVQHAPGCWDADPDRSCLSTCIIPTLNLLQNLIRMQSLTRISGAKAAANPRHEPVPVA